MGAAAEAPEGVPSLRGGIAAEVRGLMGRHQVTQKRLAAYLKAQGFQLSQPSLSKRLAGHVPWTVDELEAVAQFFDKNIMDLLPNLRWNTETPALSVVPSPGQQELPFLVERSLASVS